MSDPGTGESGFSLVELLAASAILSLMLLLVILFLDHVQTTIRMNRTRMRLETLVDKVQEYYRGQENLPRPVVDSVTVPPPLGEVPVAALHLGQKYRLDGWGQYVRYYAVRNDGVNDRPAEIRIDPLADGAPAGAPEAMITIAPDSRTLLDGLSWQGRRVAAILVSAGPDGVFAYTRTPGYPETFALASGSDDIVVAIDLSGAAMESALADLEGLSSRVEALEDRFLGVDNNGNHRVDEDGCGPIPYPGAGVLDLQIGSCADFPYYPQGGYLPVTTQDFSCFMPSLDYMKAHYCAFADGACPTGYYFPALQEYEVLPVGMPPIPTRHDCGTVPSDYLRIPFIRGNPQPDDCHWGLVATQWGAAPAPGETDADQARAFVYCLFGLAPQEMVDPWLNGYVWGCGENHGCAVDYPDTDPRYHRFFSAGPDGVPGTADDIVSTF